MVLINKRTDSWDKGNPLERDVEGILEITDTYIHRYRVTYLHTYRNFKTLVVNCHTV